MEKRGMNVYVRTLILFVITAVFSVLTYFVDRQPVGPMGTSVGFATINKAFNDFFEYDWFFVLVSDISMYIAFVVVVCFAGRGLYDLIKVKNPLKVSKVLIGLGILYVVVAVIYVAFNKIPINYRPVLMPGETELETSFPSTHALIITAVYASAVLAVERLLANEKFKRVCRLHAKIFLAVGVAARMFSGVHWLTDIFAGVLFAATLVSLYAAWIKE